MQQMKDPIYIYKVLVMDKDMNKTYSPAQVSSKKELYARQDAGASPLTANLASAVIQISSIIEIDI